MKQKTCVGLRDNVEFKITCLAEEDLSSILSTIISQKMCTASVSLAVLRTISQTLNRKNN